MRFVSFQHLIRISLDKTLLSYASHGVACLEVNIIKLTSA